MTDPTQPSQPTLPIRKIVQGKNPREYFDPAEMAELEEGIRAVGVLEPIVVRPVPGTDLYEIIAGERRWRAAKNVFGDGYDMPVVIKDANDETAEAMSVIENYHRAAMSPAEEAHAAQRQAAHQRYLEEGLAATADRRCFVATFVFGPDARETQVLRAYRDAVLLRRRWGRGLVAAYYWVAPVGCRIMARSPVIVAGVRRMLCVVVARCERSLSDRRSS